MSEAVAKIPSLSEVSILAQADIPRLDKTLGIIANGGFESDILAEQGFTHSELRTLAKSDKALKALYDDAVNQAAIARQHRREESADDRAINGTLEPMYSVKGEYLGDRRRYSDPLLMFMLKANNPNKYGDAKGMSVNTGMVLNVNLGISRDPVPGALGISRDPVQAKVIDVKEETA